MDLLEIRKKARAQKKAGSTKDDAPGASAPAVVPEAAAVAEAPPAAAWPAGAVQHVPAPAATPAASDEPEVPAWTADEFEHFLQSGPSAPPAAAFAAPASQAVPGGYPAGSARGDSLRDSLLNADFLELATEELYRHTYDVETPDTAFRQVLACLLADEEYGIDIHGIREIIKPRDITEVPRAPRYVLGIITLRGRVIPVLDLRERLGLSVSPLGRQSKIVVVAHRESFFGLLVDAVIDVAKIPEPSIESTSAVMVGVDGKYLEGIGRVGDEMIILLNLGEVLNIEGQS